MFQNKVIENWEKYQKLSAEADLIEKEFVVCVLCAKHSIEDSKKINGKYLAIASVKGIFI